MAHQNQINISPIVIQQGACYYKCLKFSKHLTKIVTNTKLFSPPDVETVKENECSSSGSYSLWLPLSVNMMRQV